MEFATWEIVLIVVASIIAGTVFGINVGVWYCHQVGKRALAQMIESGEVVLRDEDDDSTVTVKRGVRLSREGNRWYAWTTDGNDFVTWSDTLAELKREINNHRKFYVEEVVEDSAA
jgi:hypothetical protein